MGRTTTRGISELDSRKQETLRAWTSFVEQGDAAAPLVRPEILSSWTRSGASITHDVSAAPLSDESETSALWRESPLQVAVERVEADLRRTAEDGDLVLAVTDADTRILWTYGGRVMRRKAETVNFVPGARWDDESVGTNALDLANRLAEPSMVFSAEHYASIVHNWVCWAAPVLDPATGRQLGVIDLSTTWDRTHPIGLATARVMARLIETALPHSAHQPTAHATDADETADPGLVMTLLGTAEVRLDGQRLLLNRRQTEVLALLALHPEGLSLDRLHALVYGDAAVTFSTLKAEVSHLRSALGGQLSSRPYKLMMPVATDVDHVLSLLRRGRVAEALDAYGGDLLPGTNSPALTELAEYLAVAVREALLADPRPSAVLRYAELAPYDTEVMERGLAALGDRPHPARALLMGKLAAANH
ncbi:MAG: transcriptional regulator [Nocardioides sp.]|uniref:transcriptional regulator n=1 Tax=Nocardioides sp. TaxID=35761 RepID=UPI000C8EA146|nr:transcriptional regulator [Nocardioides sp.]MAS56969.1 histidine kinase [Pimelobacter sp.]MDE0776304.1 transcriptional regulator [Nocardioides sp.]